MVSWIVLGSGWGREAGGKLIESQAGPRDYTGRYKVRCTQGLANLTLTNQLTLEVEANATLCFQKPSALRRNRRKEESSRGVSVRSSSEICLVRFHFG